MKNLLFIIDEELDSLKILARNSYNEYFETLHSLNHKKTKIHENPAISPISDPLESHLFRSEKTFFNNDSKIQELRRGRFIGNLLHGISYNNHIENYQQIITDKIKKISISNLLPEDMSKRMSKTLSKKLDKLRILLLSFERNTEKIVENNNKHDFSNDNKEEFLNNNEDFLNEIERNERKSQVLRLIEKEILEQGSLLNNLKTALFFNNKTELAENTPEVSLGISSDLI